MTIKLNLGSGKAALEGYINIDAFVVGPGILNYDILRLPFESGSVDEILAEHIFEHVAFGEEESLWQECHRLLAVGGRLIVETPDMEWLCDQFVRAKDDFVEFYQVGAKDHFFGHGRNVDHRWSVLIANIYGNQNGPGQFHKNAYTAHKLMAIA